MTYRNDTQTLIIRAKVDVLTAPRHPVHRGDLRWLRHDVPRRDARSALAGEPIEWGGVQLQPSQYEVLWHGHTPDAPTLDGVQMGTLRHEFPRLDWRGHGTHAAEYIGSGAAGFSLTVWRDRDNGAWRWTAIVNSERRAFGGGPNFPRAVEDIIANPDMWLRRNTGR